MVDGSGRGKDLQTVNRDLAVSVDAARNTQILDRKTLAAVADMGIFSETGEQVKVKFASLPCMRTRRRASFSFVGNYL